MGERVALEPHQATHLTHCQSVIRSGREILYAWDGAEAPEPALAEALEQYAAALAQGIASALPLSPQQSEHAQRVAQQIARLPDWTSPAERAGEQAQGATPS